MRARVAGVTSALPFNARDTVATETFASRATSLIVTTRGPPCGLTSKGAQKVPVRQSIRNINVFIPGCKRFQVDQSQLQWARWRNQPVGAAVVKSQAMDGCSDVPWRARRYFSNFGAARQR